MYALDRLSVSYDTDTLRSRLSCCADDINSCCKSRRLQLNVDKTETIWVGSRSNLAKIANSYGSIQVGSSNIQPSTDVRDLGLHLDSELSMKHHVTKVAAACKLLSPPTPPPDPTARVVSYGQFRAPINHFWQVITSFWQVTRPLTLTPDPRSWSTKSYEVVF